MGNLFAITSGKGGTGKSTVSAGLAISFARLGKKVLIIDLDEGLRCLDLMFGIDRELVFDLADMLNLPETANAVYPVAKFPGLSLIPAPQNVGSVDPEKFSHCLNRALGEYDVIILDFPAGIDFRFYRCLPNQVRYLTVCNPDPVSVRDAAAVCERLPDVKIPPRLILNKFDYRKIRDGIFQNIDSIIDSSGFRLLGIVPLTEELSLFPVTHDLHRKKRSFMAFDRIARRTDDPSVVLPKLKKI